MKALGVLTLAALAVLAAALPARAQSDENWRQVQTLDGIVFALDLNSIKPVGSLRHFRIRVTFTDSAKTTVGYYDNAADCAAKTVDTLYGTVSDKGETLRKQAFKPGEMRNSLEDEQGKLLYPLVCG